MKWPIFLCYASIFVGCTTTTENMTWQSIEKSLQTQLITMRDSSEIRLPEGNFMFANSLLLDDKHFVTIQGAGIDKTVLSFAQQQSGAEGLKISNCSNIRLKDLTIEDAKGDNIKVTDTYGIEFDGVKSHWNGEPKEENGAYAFYPVLCKNVVIQNCIAAGASDAGIYVGQSDSVTIRYNKVYYNVAGIESENSRWVEIHGNEAFKNTGGILIFDLPGLTQLGHTTRVFNNVMEENNYKNFAPEGNIVAAVPPGTGMMLLATRDIEIFDNQFINNRTSGLAIASYDLVSAMSTEEGSQLNNNIETARQDASYDPYPTGIYVHSNSFENGKLLPTTQNEFGLLFMMKFPFGTPDIVWDGIAPDRESFEFCLENNGEFKFADLDAANDFESLNTDWVAFNCRGTNINPIF